MSDQARRVPADRGLSGLGLMMQLFGTVAGALTALGGVALFAQLNARSMYSDNGPGGSELMWLLLLVGTGVARSLVHRSIGEGLLYGHQPFAKVKTYLLAASVNTAMWLYVLVEKGGAPGAVALPFACLLMAWPIAVAVIVRLPGIREMSDQVPHGEDHGFEGVSILMVMFGLFWTIAMGLFIYTEWQTTPAAIHNSGFFMLQLIAMGVLLIRSALQLSAGLQGLRVTQLDLAVAAANRYADFGVVATFVTAGCLLLSAMMSMMSLFAMGLIACLVWMLLAWPMILRRFYNERQFADLMASPDGTSSTHRRAPDLGLTTLGWFLFAVALVQLSAALPTLLVGSGGAVRGEYSQLLGAVATMTTPTADHSAWWGVGLAGIQLWAGIELIRMSDLHRIAANAFGVIQSVVTIYFYFPMLRHLGDAHVAGSPTTVSVAVLALDLIVPVTTLLVANRSAMPAAQARVRG